VLGNSHARFLGEGSRQRLSLIRFEWTSDLYHQLTSTISKVNGGRMPGGKNEIELKINTECIRLIANIIIHHNATILSALYQHYDLKDPDKCPEIRPLFTGCLVVCQPDWQL
jgi:hypothetical protein